MVQPPTFHPEAYEAAARVRPWENPSKAEQSSVDPTTALDLFDAAARTAPALCYFDHTLDYAALDMLATRLAAWLQERGVQRGDRVAIVLQNTPQFVIATLAAWKLAAIAVPLNPMYRVPELSKLFADCTPRAVICHDEQWSAVIEAARGVVDAASVLWTSPRELQRRDDARVLPAPSKAPATQSLAAVFASAPVQRVDASPIVAEDVAVLLYTSGTTGMPKGAMLTHRGLVFNARICVRHFRLTSASRIFGLAPMFHVTGFEVQMVSAFAAGASEVLTYRFQPSVVLDAFVEHRPTFIIGAITAFIALMNQPQASLDHFTSFEHIYSGGAPIAPAVVEAFEQRFGRSIRNSYGMTELTAPSHLAPAEGHTPVDETSGALSIGLPTPGIDVIVIDDTGQPVGTGILGELVVRGPNVMAGYWRKPDETSQVLEKGWMHTGDVGFFDAAGWFYLVDRKKDMICAAGCKVGPREVEDVLYAFPGVREAAVVGAPDAYRGETVIAFVSASEGAELDVAAVEHHCRERLAAYKCPVAIHVLSELPKTESGKITRAALAQRLLSP
jgi:long-chain acyl-CoA synthetase